jgi:integrase/recombinase XerD
LILSFSLIGQPIYIDIYPPSLADMQIKQAGSEFLRGYFATHDRSVKTRIAYHSDLNQFLLFLDKNIDISAINGQHIESWAAVLKQKNYSPASIRRKMIVLKVFCSYWVRQGTLQESPFWRVKLSYGRIEQLPRTLTKAEMSGLLSRAKCEYEENPQGKKETNGEVRSSTRNYRVLRNLALIELLFATGMRVGEVSALNVKDFLIDESSFRIRGKGGRERLAFIVDTMALQVLKDYLLVREFVNTESSALFLNTTSKRLSEQGIANVISQLRKAEGIDRHVTPHMLRHTVATLLLRNGVDIRIVQEFLGHASIATTQRYTHISKEHIIKELQLRHPSLSIRV